MLFCYRLGSRGALLAALVPVASGYMVYQMAIKAIPNTVTAALVSQNISEVSKFTPKLCM